MGHGWCSAGCTYHFCLDWMMSKKKNLIIVGITVGLYVLNQIIKTKIPIEAIKWFMSCYFNDTIGGITFVAYCNLIFGFFIINTIKI